MCSKQIKQILPSTKQDALIADSIYNTGVSYVCMVISGLQSTLTNLVDLVLSLGPLCAAGEEGPDMPSAWMRELKLKEAKYHQASEETWSPGLPSMSLLPSSLECERLSCYLAVFNLIGQDMDH